MRFDEGQCSFGCWLLRLRRQAGLTQESLADRAGLSVRTIRNIESDQTTRVQQATLDGIVRGLGLSADAAAAIRALQRNVRNRATAGHGFRPDAEREGSSPSATAA